MEVLRKWNKDPLQGVFWGFVTFLVGLILVWPVPALVLRAYEKATLESISSSQTAWNQADMINAHQEEWFAPKYGLLAGGRRLKDLLTTADILLNGQDGAVAIAKDCGGLISKHIDCLQAAKAKADEAWVVIFTVRTKLDENGTLRSNARLGLKTFSVSIVSTQLEETKSQFAAESPNHLVKYTDGMRVDLDELTGKLKIVGDHVSYATNAMPPDDSKSQSGDPQLALDELYQAKTLVDEINTLMGEVTAGIGKLTTARTQAGPTADQAMNSISTADQVINSINNRYGWGFELALRPSVSSLTEARLQLEAARNTLSILVLPEGKTDWTLAYAEAQSSLSAAQSAKSSAEKQEKDYQSAVTKIGRYPADVAEANTAISSATSAENTLRNNHATDTWSIVSGNLPEADQKLREAENGLLIAKSYISLASQRFTEADGIAQASLDLVAAAKTKALAVSTLAETLEGFRKDWPGLELQAQNTISDEQPGSDSDNCAYSSEARSDLADAGKYLSQARTEASNGYYESANSLATSAFNSADGVNGRCIRAYNDEMGSRTQVAAVATQQEQSRIAAQEAADKAAKEAAERAIEEASQPADTGGYEPEPYDPPSSDGGGWSDSGSSSPSDGGGWDE